MCYRTFEPLSDVSKSNEESVRDLILGFGVLASGDPEWELRDPRWTCGMGEVTLLVAI